MYKHIGKKIKILAKVIAWLNAVVCTAAGLFLILAAVGNQNDIPGIVFGISVIVFGILLSWTGSFVLYGFGQLVDNSDRLVKNSSTRDYYGG